MIIKTKKCVHDHSSQINSVRLSYIFNRSKLISHVKKYLMKTKFYC